MNAQITAQILRVLGLLPLLAYPAVLVANAMQASALIEAKKRGETDSASRNLMSLFVGGTTIYPLVVLASRALSDKSNDETGKLAWSVGPFAFIGALAALFAMLDGGESAS